MSVLGPTGPPRVCARAAEDSVSGGRGTFGWGVSPVWTPSFLVASSRMEKSCSPRTLGSFLPSFTFFQSVNTAWVRGSDRPTVAPYVF